MGLDVRFPIAFLFLVLGGLLAVFGAFSNPSIYVRSLGINVNLAWGGILFLFGVVLWLAARHSAASAKLKSRESPLPAVKP